MINSQCFLYVIIRIRQYKKKPVNKLLKPELQLHITNNKKYKMEIIYNNTISVKKIISQLLGLYYLVSWKNYLKDKNI